MPEARIDTLFECPTCGGPHFNVTPGGQLICSSVSKHTDWKPKMGGCGWKGTQDDPSTVTGTKLGDETQRADTLGENCMWFITRIDEIHRAICPGQRGTYPQRVLQCVAEAKRIELERLSLKTASDKPDMGICEACEGFGWIFCGEDGLELQCCDNCNKYEGDLEAANAYFAYDKRTHYLDAIILRDAEVTIRSMASAAEWYDRAPVGVREKYLKTVLTNDELVVWYTDLCTSSKTAVHKALVGKTLPAYGLLA